jgi:histone H3
MKSLPERLERACKNVLKRARPEMGIKKSAKRAICQAVYWCADSLVATAFTHLPRGKVTGTLRDLQCAIRLLLPSKLANRSIAEATKGLVKFYSAQQDRSEAARIVLLVSPSLIRPLLDSKFRRVAKSSAVYLAAFLEFMMAEILLMSCDVAEILKKKSSRILTPRHVYFAVMGDEELGNLFKRAMFLSGGVLPTLHPAVVPKKTLQVTKKPLATKDGSEATAPYRPHRYRSGAVRQREIRKQQKSTDLILSRASFTRLTREVIQNSGDRKRIGVDALNVLQGGIESYMISILRAANIAALHAGRTTVMPKDLHVIRRIRE